MNKTRSLSLGGELDEEGQGDLGELARVFGGDLVESVLRGVDVGVDVGELGLEGERRRIARLGPARVITLRRTKTAGVIK